jgi:DNA polymerase III subunit epsilon
MREIVFDTETTGIKPEEGHRVVEIGALELMNHLPTGKTFHVYINPERDMPSEAERIHGLSSAFLKDKPTFKEVAQDFLAFIGEATLIAHNASFDMSFINHHLKKENLLPLPASRVIDSLALARKKFGNSGNSLDALCKRFNIDNSNRTYHGALLDSELLAQVYLELIGGRQFGMGLEGQKKTSVKKETNLSSSIITAQPRHKLTLSEEENTAHEAYIAKMQNSLWLSS